MRSARDSRSVGPARPMAQRPEGPRRGADPRRRGQVLIITLIAMSLLVGLLFYVYNVGDQVNQRLEMQGAADAVAITGATWIARNMNVVGMNNVGMTKMLSLVPILDAQPLGARMAHDEVKAWEEALATITRQGRIDPQSTGTTEDYLREGTESLRQRMETQRDILQPFAEAINPPNFDMERTTHWAKQGVGGAPPHGTLWRAAMTMEEFSRSAVETCGELAQQRAGRMGRRDSATSAFLVPVRPEMPAREGQYMDFQPTLTGRCKVTSDTCEVEWTGGNGGAIPDYAFPHRLGPWARLHRWRDYISEFIVTGHSWVPGRPGAGSVSGVDSVVGGLGGRSVGRSAVTPNQRGSQGHYRNEGYSELYGYHTYGPYEWAKRHIRWWARGSNEDPGKLRDTRYWEYLRTLADIKLGYMFPEGGIGEATMTKEIHYPVWISSYPEAKAIGDNPDNQVHETLNYVVEIASKYPEQSPAFLTPGTFRTNGDYPIAVWGSGWRDPNNIPGSQMVSNYVWKSTDTYQTTGDPELGIPQQTIPPGDPGGEPVWQTVYFYQWVFFGGIDIGGTIEVSNPANWDRFDRLPVPILLDTSQGDYGGDDPDVAWRRERFMYLGVARKDTEAKVWPQRFSHVNPIRGTLTVAQAKVFNNKSFGLWTQDWRAALAPVTRLTPSSDPQSWTARLESDIGDAAGMDSVDQAEVEAAFQYLSRFDADLVRTYMSP